MKSPSQSQIGPFL